MKTDTIAAAATAMSDSGIGIIRVSGENAVEIVDKIYRNSKNNKTLLNYKSHTIHYGFIVDKNNTVIDEVMISVMKAPKSYTMENTVEINCHGGIFIMQKILSVVISFGARLAEPGEFTKRAFLNGRIDLSKAEAVMDIIHAKNEFALKSSVRQLKGDVSDKIRDLRNELLYEVAFIESAIDDSEHISLDGYHERLSEKTECIIDKLDKLLVSADNGRILKEGINTVILGKPNVGKSSLLNILAGEERAIVTEIAGTTRDILEENISFGGIMLNIIDTAGIRNTEDMVEKIGVEKAVKISQNADLIIYIVDASLPLDDNDKKIFPLLENKNVIILINKSDLNQIVDEKILREFIGEDIEKKITVIKTSTKEKRGMDDLEKAVKDMFLHGKISLNDETYITNIRHKEAIEKAKESMLQVRKSLEMNMPEDFYSIDLMSAYSFLGTVIGEEVGEDLVNEIFSRFCMGK